MRKMSATLTLKDAEPKAWMVNLDATTVTMSAVRETVTRTKSRQHNLVCRMGSRAEGKTIGKVVKNGWV